MRKFCFVISPMGDEDSPTRARADFVLDTYIRPACELADFEAVRADHGIGQNIVQGVTSTLSNAPMAIAYLGAPSNCRVATCSGSSFWNANVMIEVGYRLASRLPLLFICDRGADGKIPDLPLTLKSLNVLSLPVNPTADSWLDTRVDARVQDLVKQLREAECAPRYLDSIHGLATIHASNRDTHDPCDLVYTAVSPLAETLFGVTKSNPAKGSAPRCQSDSAAKRLVGRSMTEFLEGVQERMHPVQWSKFEQDQRKARADLREGPSDDKTSTAAVPIVFESHEDDRYNNRAYLPIITQDFRPSDNAWYNLRVLYLNVTSVTRKVSGNAGEEYYVCDLDPSTDVRLDPIKFTGNAVKVFLSYSSRNRPIVDDLYVKLKSVFPFIEPFADTELGPGQDWSLAVMENLSQAEACMLLLDDEQMGDGEARELNLLIGRLMTTAVPNKCKIIPVLLGQKRTLPFALSTLTPVFYDQLGDAKLQNIFAAQFPDRCPAQWRQKYVLRPLQPA